MSIVEVRPIEKEKWHGLKGQFSFAKEKVIEALVSLQSGQYATGLSEEDRKRLEKLTGYDLSPEYNPNKVHPFWSSQAAQIKLGNRTTIFDTSKPLDEIKVKVLKASDLVANSWKEYEEGLYPEALFVIFDEKEEVELKASKLALKKKVIIESEKLSLDRKAEIILITTGIPVRKQSADYIDLKLEEATEKVGPQTILDLIKRDKQRTSTHALVLEAIHKRVLRKEGTAVYYMEDQLGFDIESAVDYLQDSKNQALKAQILERIN